jgi:hypothetical protein
MSDSGYDSDYGERRRREQERERAQERREERRRREQERREERRRREQERREKRRRREQERREERRRCEQERQYEQERHEDRRRRKERREHEQERQREQERHNKRRRYEQQRYEERRRREQEERSEQERNEERSRYEERRCHQNREVVRVRRQEIRLQHNRENAIQSAMTSTNDQDRVRPLIRNEGREAVDDTVAILSGRKDISACSIGVRRSCVYCNAKLWVHETKWSEMCCRKGKIVLQKWRIREVNSETIQEQYAGKIHSLWEEESAEGKLLRQFARPLNNALALASQVVDEKGTFGNGHVWVPNVIIKGKLFHKMPYSLIPAEGATPKFAQIYVYDPQQDEGAEAEIRLGHMRLQSGTTMATRDKLVGLLTKLQRWLRMCNGYIHDFIQVCEIPSEQVETMELVISAILEVRNTRWRSRLTMNLLRGQRTTLDFTVDALERLQRDLIY